MSKSWDEAKAAVMARASEPCEHCRPEAERLTDEEMGNRSGAPLNRVAAAQL
jgi:hypothetical protein